jgi:hypothetical protein
MALTRSEVHASAARLTVTVQGSRLSQYVVGDGASVMIGSGNNCGIRLEDNSISSIHGIVRMAEGQLFVQDWCSAIGTFLGPTRVDEETVVPNASTIRVGRYDILVELTDKYGKLLADRATSKAVEISAEFDAPVKSNGDVSDDLDVDTFESQDDVGEVDSADSREIEYDSATDSDETSDADRHADVDAPPGRMSPSSHGYTAGDDRRRSEALVLAGIDPETVSLLQAEIECLQSELSERDRELTELQSAERNRSVAAPEVDSTAMEALVGRLEELLDELEASDQRTRVLEDLLRTEQEVSRAQLEEQSQVEAWLKDIERRVVAREQEWQAERETLVRRAQLFKEERDESDRRFEAVEQSPHGGAPQLNVVKELRSQIDDLQDQLEAADRTRQSLQAELDKMKSKSPDEARRELVEEAMREERLKLAQEQAAVSRERAQLAKHLAEIEQQTHRERRAESDERFRAFRQTLKELHHQEQVTTPGIRKASLGTRIADLWRKLDGPTDTD